MDVGDKKGFESLMMTNSRSNTLKSGAVNLAWNMTETTGRGAE